MAKPRNPKKVAGKKAAPKRGVVKPTPRLSNKEKAKINEELLSADIKYYNSVSPGVLKKAPVYTPLHKNGKIVAYRNTINQKIVSVRYRERYYTRYFYPKPEDGEKLSSEELARVEATDKVRNQQRRIRTAHTKDLVGSYQLRHPNMSRKEIRQSADFQDLVLQLESYSARAYGITPENMQILDEIYGPADYEDFLKGELAKNPAYQDVLVKLGRRLPGETAPVGSYAKGHIKLVVAPYYENPFNFPNSSANIKNFE